MMMAVAAAGGVGRLVKRGAEADILEADWNGMPSVSKIRKAKAYRHPQLDARIRRRRTVRESQTLSYAKSLGVATPLVYFVDPQGCEIVMQRIPGTPVSALPPDQIVSCCRRMGRMAGLLHRGGVMHGDLTTSNFILSRGSDRICLVDFGLSVRTDKPEDHAVDLRLIKEILNSAHARIADASWKKFVAGYGSVVGASYKSGILGLVLAIEARGRYAAVV